MPLTRKTFKPILETTMKHLIRILALIILFGSPLASLAVTQKEMDRARALAAKAYLRYANDGSGYLDEINPTSMADLEKRLKAKEKENIKAFRSIPVPSGYESWNKEKLVEYWSVKAFASKGLVEKGRQGKARARKYIGAMSVTPPSAPKEESKKEEPKKEEPKKEDASKGAAAETAPAATVVARPDSVGTASPADASAGADESEPQLQKVNDNTWIYIVILCVLVAVVVALVVFASNVMKKSESAASRNVSPRQGGSPEGMPVAADDSDVREMRERFAASIQSKNNEISVLSKKVETLNATNATLKGNLESLTAEVATLRTRLAETAEREETARKALQAAQAAPVHPAAPAAATQAPTPAPAATEPRQGGAEQQPRQAQQPLRTIYLGRANAKGIFVRADRSLNVGNSVFRLDTADGFAGTFRVASDPTVWEMALLTPTESLAYACTGADLDNTAGMSRIVNDSAGTAIFEGGCWKVIRKAKIHYE